jgi:hypothetical protein
LAGVAEWRCGDELRGGELRGGEERPGPGDGRGDNGATREFL